VKPLYLAAAAAAFIVAWSPAGAQAPADRPASPCEKLAGVERERCLAEEKRERERLGREDEGKRRSCDDLFGPEKELCLKRGGTVRAGAPSSSSGGSAAPSNGAPVR
jgi:hypothetical protein